MSNIGKKPISIPEGVQLSLNKENSIEFSGKQGKIQEQFSKEISFKISDKEVILFSKNKALHGTERTRLYNSILGVSQGFQKRLLLVGIGYRVKIIGQELRLKVGFSHELLFNLPQGIKAISPKSDQILLFGMKKAFLHRVASEIRSLKKPDPYKGKGIRFENEVLILKEGKKNK